jgi:hypothetical protein
VIAAARRDVIVILSENVSALSPLGRLYRGAGVVILASSFRCLFTQTGTPISALAAGERAIQATRSSLDLGRDGNASQILPVPAGGCGPAHSPRVPPRATTLTCQESTRSKLSGLSPVCTSSTYSPLSLPLSLPRGPYHSQEGMTSIAANRMARNPSTARIQNRRLGEARISRCKALRISKETLTWPLRGLGRSARRSCRSSRPAGVGGLRRPVGTGGLRRQGPCRALGLLLRVRRRERGARGPHPASIDN